MKRDEPLMSAKELARKLARCDHYVYKAVKKGLPNYAGRFDLEKSLHWLRRNPGPYSRQKG